MKPALTIFVLLLSLSVFGQKQEQARIDSLLKELPKAKEDRNKVKLLQELCYCYSTINPAKGIDYGTTGLNLAKKLNWKKGIASVLTSLGSNYDTKSNYPKEIELDLESLKIDSELENKEGISSNLGNIGSAYMSQGKFQDALYNFFKAFDIDKSTNNKEDMAKDLSNIGSVYFYQSNYPKALDYYFKALAIFESESNNEGIAGMSENIGNIYETQISYNDAINYYFKALGLHRKLGDSIGQAADLSNLGNQYEHLNNISKALEFHFEGLNFYRKIKRDEGVAISLANIGSDYNALNNYSKSLEYFLKSYDINKSRRDKNLIVANLVNIGGTYLDIAKDTTIKIKPGKFVKSSKQANLRLAIKYLNEGVSICKDIGNKDQMISLNNALFEAYRKSGNYKKAFEVYKEYIIYRDSVYSIKNVREIDSLEAARQSVLNDRSLQIKDREILNQKLKRKETEINTRNLFIFSISISFIFILLLFAFLWYRSNSARKVVKLRYQIADDLHEEIGSDLNSILLFSQAAEKHIELRQFTEARENINEIGNTSEELADLIRDIIWAIKSWSGSFQAVIDRLQKKMFPPLIAKGIELKLIYDESIKNLHFTPTQFNNLYLICKEVLNNAAKHSCCKKITIKFEKRAKVFEVSIKDDGKGFDLQKTSEGNGLKNIQNRSFEIKAALTLISKTNEGTEINLRLDIPHIGDRFKRRMLRNSHLKK